MRFGPVPVAAAKGAVLAHSVTAGGRRLAKGRVLSCDDLSLLRSDGVAEVVAAQLDLGDVGEDLAASRLAAALVPDPASAGLILTAPHAGRVNLVAGGPGVIGIDAGAVHALNRVHPSITLATLMPWQRVTKGMLAGTVKIIAYAVPQTALAAAEAAAGGAMRLCRVRMGTASLILTDTSGDAAQDSKLNAKAIAAVAGRLTALGMRLSDVRTVGHAQDAIRSAILRATGEMILILTGAATSDLHDDAPQALRAAGGRVARFGMPVDPGNLLFHGVLGDRPVIGLPGCARSPALNGADWVLERLACGIAVGDADIAAMGVGGLLKEIPIRPKPRETR